MQVYILIFLNFIIFHILSYMEFNLFIEKLNIMSIFTVILFYIFAIYSKVILKNIFYIHPSSLLMLMWAITYNSILSNTFLVILSTFLFILFFILDRIYNSINLNFEKVYTKKEVDFKTIKHTIKAKKENIETYIQDYSQTGINMKLEGSLVLLGVTHDYTLAELKTAYKIALKNNNPKKFSKSTREKQEVIVKDINEAKSYLEHRFI
ncbi:MAG: J domain-containing protein [Sulfurimonas sp.]|nr:J domain-containing protein [Sulfurimonas sp.]